MTLQEAYTKAKTEGEKYGLVRLKELLDFGNSWGFLLMPQGEDVIGPGHITVNKKNGTLRNVHPHTDWALYSKSKPISIEQFVEYNVAV